MKSLFLLLLISNSIYSIGQETTSSLDTTIIEIESTSIEDFPIIGERDPEAQFPGGHVALLKYIHNELDWGCINMTDSILEHSKVYLSFMIEEDGSIANVSVDRGINQNIDECCVDFIKKMPKWIPATDRNGKPVAQRVRLPIIICLD